MAGRFLQAFKPVSRFLPEVSPPDRKVGLNEKIFWTIMALAIYLVMREVPLYGVGLRGGWELTYMRVIFASGRGSLMELGIGPVVTAGLILQLLAGSGIITCDFSNPEDRALFTVASKFFSIVMTGVQASAYIIGGVYGSLDPRVALIVFLELLAAGVVIILLDEMIQKGWGIGSGVSLFILAGVAQNIIWDSLDPLPGGDGKSHGAIVAFIQTILNGEPIQNALFRRGGLPTLIGLFATIAVFLVVIYAQGVRVEVPISYARFRGFRGRYPIALLYVSNLPVIFTSALFANIYFWSQFLWSNYNRNNSNIWLNILGMYQLGDHGPEPIGGLAYYVTAPRSLLTVIENPTRALVFVLIMIVCCIFFSITWLEVGGLSPRMVAKQLVDSGMQIPGFRRSSRPIELVLQRYIPTVAILGGIIVGLIAAISDFLGVFGSGTGILLAVGIVYQYYQLLMREQVLEMYPALKRFLGE